MKRIVTFLLVLVTMVGIIGYSPISAKSKVKDTSPNYYGKGIGASYDFEYNTDTKYKIVVKDADSYKDLAQGEEEYWNSYTKENYCVNYYSSASKIQVQLQLVSTKTGKAVKNSKVKFYGWNYYDEPNPDYLTKDGKFTFHRLPNREDYIDNE